MNRHLSLRLHLQAFYLKLKKFLPQLLTLLFIVLVFGFFTMNAQENMDTRGIEFGFGFLTQEASFDKYYKKRAR